MLPELWTMPGTGWTLKSYGFMLMVGFLSAAYLAMRRAMRVKCDPDVVLNCHFIGLITGVVGARAFYVLHYWNESFANRPDTFLAIINIRQGGLEFLGGLLAGTASILLYLRLYGHSMRLYSDILAIATMWALGIARMGCFLNGCCFGGVCVDGAHNPRLAVAVEFPFGSPALVRQWQERRITLPAELINDSVTTSTSATLWEAMPLGRDMLYMPIARRERPMRAFEKFNRQYLDAKAKDSNSEETQRLAKEYKIQKRLYDENRLKIISLLRAQLFPSRVDPSRPNTTVGELRAIAAQYPALWVHPTQLYSTVSAILLSVLLGRVFHRRKRHGVVFGLMFVAYPLSRFFLEMIREDNPLDTLGLTISQAIGVALFAAGCVILFVLYRFLPQHSPRATPFVPQEEEDS